MLLKKQYKKFVMLSSMGADKPEEASQLQEYFKHNADEYLKSNCNTVLCDLER
jgi:hypothetical protein